MIHNRYLHRGGEDESTDAELALLRSRGHQAELYEESNRRVASLSSLRVGIRASWSPESRGRILDLIHRRRPDVVHVQNFFPLISPSVHWAARSAGIPVVQSLRNYRLLCPSANFYRAGAVCEECMGRSLPWPGVVHRCYRQSASATAGVAAMLVTHRLLGTWWRKVDGFIALTEFSRNKLVEGGLPPERLFVKPNFVHPDPGAGDGAGGYWLFVGRLAPEKGVETLLAAWRALDGRLPLKIVGDGPQAPAAERAAQRWRSVEWLGRRSQSEVMTLLAGARAVIVPSRWYETFGRVAVEAFATGTPVIASNLGALSELVDRGVTGLKFEAGNAEQLAARVLHLERNPKELAEMRDRARKTYLERFTAASNYRRLMEIYRQVGVSAGSNG